MGVGRRNTPADDRSKWESGGCHDSSCLEAKKKLPIKGANLSHLTRLSMKIAAKHGNKIVKRKDGKSSGYKGTAKLDPLVDKAAKTYLKTSVKAD